MALQSSSSFRLSGARDERRRRLLADELSNHGDWPVTEAWPDTNTSGQKSNHYGKAEFLRQQPRLLDLLPRRRIGLAALALVLTAIAVGIEVAYQWMADRAADGGGTIAALDVSAKGSLGCWFCTLMFLAASGAAVLVLSVRRNRNDDYQGRYRIWRWAVAGWLLLATDKAASLREAFRDLMIALTGASLAGDGALWWIILYTFLVGAVGSRLLLDMRPNWFAISVLFVAIATGSAAIVARMDCLPLPDDCRQAMVIAGCEMLCGVASLMAMILHARYVLLDAEGLLPHKARASKDASKTSVEKSQGQPAIPAGGRWTKVDPPQEVPQKPVFQCPAAVIASKPSPPPPAVAPTPNRKLTKAERRALKDRLMQERLEREARRL